jgi:hypothetical protein
MNYIYSNTKAMNNESWFPNLLLPLIFGFIGLWFVSNIYSGVVLLILKISNRTGIRYFGLLKFNFLFPYFIWIVLCLLSYNDLLLQPSILHIYLFILIAPFLMTGIAVYRQSKGSTIKEKGGY